jgi:molybdate transport system substrate-binding protein
VAGSRFTYAIGELVLWSPQPGLVDGQGAVLGAGRWKHLAIANPKTAPYGRAALEVLRARGLEASVAPKLVTAESIAQAQQFVASGNAELGFIAWSQLSVPGQAPTGSWWRVPAALHEEIRQDAVLLKPGQGKAAATALLAYLKAEPAQAEIRAWGYRVPGDAAAPAKPGKP